MITQATEEPITARLLQVRPRLQDALHRAKARQDAAQKGLQTKRQPHAERMIELRQSSRFWENTVVENVEELNLKPRKLLPQEIQITLIQLPLIFCDVRTP